MTLISSQGSFSQYLDSDPEFEDALLNVALPGDEEVVGSIPTVNNDAQAPPERQDVPSTVEGEVKLKKRSNEDNGSDMDSDDEVEAHLRRKRIKLQSSSQPASQPSRSQGHPKSQCIKQEPVSSPVTNRTSSRTLTSVDGAAFIESFYQKSRLHHLSTWKAELKVLVREAAKGNTTILHQEQAAKNDVKPNTSPRAGTTNFFNLSSNQRTQAPPQRDKTIFHVDFDCFFASVGILDRSHLRDKPVVVCHSQVSGNNSSGSNGADISERDLWEGKHGGKKTSMSEVSSANYVARAYGIKNGML
jgi:hypothetical protein